jgi:hypothetical protein
VAAKFQRLMTIHENHHVRGPGHVLDIISFIKFLVFFFRLGNLSFQVLFCRCDFFEGYILCNCVAVSSIVLCVCESYVCVHDVCVSVSMCMSFNFF